MEVLTREKSEVKILDAGKKEGKKRRGKEGRKERGRLMLHLYQHDKNTVGKIKALEGNTASPDTLPYLTLPDTTLLPHLPSPKKFPSKVKGRLRQTKDGRSRYSEEKMCS